MKFLPCITVLSLISGATAFSSPFGIQSSFSSSKTSLYGRKRGGLAKSVGQSGVSTKKKKTSRNVKTRDTVKDPPTSISSSLSKWAANLDTDGSTDINQTPDKSKETSIANTDSSTFERFESTSSLKKSSRRERSTSRREKDASKNRQTEAIILSISERIESNNLSIESLLLDIKNLIKLQPSVTLKALMNRKINNYSLAWVGADEAICHVGTGLHKVPLARLQDIFFSLGRDESGQAKTAALLEVIRILGPFPNVRNTLQGSVVDAKSVERDFMGVSITENKIKIMYDSMMDGLGKEINAGAEGNIRYVDLNVFYADEKALVCTVPTDGEENDDLDDEFGENGKNVLLFLKEEDLDLKLEELRAA